MTELSLDDITALTNADTSTKYSKKLIAATGVATVIVVAVIIIFLVKSNSENSDFSPNGTIIDPGSCNSYQEPTFSECTIGRDDKYYKRKTEYIPQKNKPNCYNEQIKDVLCAAGDVVPPGCSETAKQPSEFGSCLLNPIDKKYYKTQIKYEPMIKNGINTYCPVENKVECLPVNCTYDLQHKNDCSNSTNPREYDISQIISPALYGGSCSYKDPTTGMDVKINGGEILNITPCGTKQDCVTTKIYTKGDALGNCELFNGIWTRSWTNKVLQNALGAGKACPPLSETEVCAPQDCKYTTTVSTIYDNSVGVTYDKYVVNSINTQAKNGGKPCPMIGVTDKIDYSKYAGQVGNQKGRSKLFKSGGIYTLFLKNPTYYQYYKLLTYSGSLVDFAQIFINPSWDADTAATGSWGLNMKLTSVTIPTESSVINYYVIQLSNDIEPLNIKYTHMLGFRYQTSQTYDNIAKPGEFMVRGSDQWGAVVYFEPIPGSTNTYHMVIQGECKFANGKMTSFDAFKKNWRVFITRGETRNYVNTLNDFNLDHYIHNLPTAYPPAVSPTAYQEMTFQIDPL